jgi:hypothetical protein
VSQYFSFSEKLKIIEVTMTEYTNRKMLCDASICNGLILIILGAMNIHAYNTIPDVDCDSCFRRAPASYGGIVIFVGIVFLLGGMMRRSGRVAYWRGCGTMECESVFIVMAVIFMLTLVIISCVLLFTAGGNQSCTLISSLPNCNTYSINLLVLMLSATFIPLVVGLLYVIKEAFMCWMESVDMCSSAA